MKRLILLPVIVLFAAISGGVSVAHTLSSKNSKRIVIQFDKIAQKNIKTNIVSALRLDKKNRLPNHFSSTLNMNLALERILKTVQGAVSPYGYYNSTLTRKLTRHTKQWVANYHLTLGPRVILTHLNAPTPADLPKKAKKRIRDSWPLKLNQPFLTTQYQEAKSLIVNTARDYGYLDTKLTVHKAAVNLQNHTASVTLIYTLGKRYHFSKTHFKAGDKLNFLKRFLRYQAGDPYLARRLTQSRDGFISSNYFDTVSVNPKPNKKTHEVPVNIVLTPPVHQLYTVGAGFGTDTGIRGSLQAQFQRLNNSGHQASLFVRGSAINSAGILSYSIPGKYPPTDSYTISGLVSQLDLNGTANSKKITLASHFVRDNWSQTFSLSALRETYDITATTINYPKTNTFLVLPSWVIERHYFDNAKHPTFGYHLYAHITGTLKSLVSKTTFFQANLKLAVMKEFFKHERIIARAQLGYTDIKTLGDLPLTLQLFTGGSESIRGFSYLSIGPGRMLAVGSLEFQQEIYPNYYIGAFVDAGNVGGSEIFHKKPHIGVGPAFTWDSPVGHVSVSAGWAVSTPNHHPVLLQFSLGVLI